MKSERRQLFDAFKEAQRALFELGKKMPVARENEVYWIRFTLAQIENAEIDKDERIKLIMED